MKSHWPLFIFLMTGVFTFQTFDVPPARHAVNPKTCCGRVICLCKHAKGAPCDFRSQKKMCHLPKQSSDVPALKTQDPAAQEKMFTKAPCHSETPKTIMTGHTKDCDLISFKPLPLNQKDEFFDSAFIRYPLFDSISSLDPPPRVFLSL